MGPMTPIGLVVKRYLCMECSTVPSRPPVHENCVQGRDWIALHINNFGRVSVIGISPHLHHPRLSCVGIARIRRPLDLIPGRHLAAWQIAYFSDDRPPTTEIERIVHGVAGIRQQLGVTVHHGDGKICAPPLPPAPIARTRLSEGQVVQDSARSSDDWVCCGYTTR